MIRPLWETLVEILESVSPDAASGVRVASVRLDLPIEVEIRSSGDGLAFLADVPRWRWATDFDPQRGRVKLDCGQGAFDE